MLKIHPPFRHPCERGSSAAGVVDDLPTQVGVDSCNNRLERNSDDNVGTADGAS